MKIKKGFELRQVGDEYVAITVGDAAADFNGMIKINNTGVFIWNELQKGVEPDKLIDMFAGEFAVDKAVADRDVNMFIDTLKQANCFED